MIGQNEEVFRIPQRGLGLETCVTIHQAVKSVVGHPANMGMPQLFQAFRTGDEVEIVEYGHVLAPSEGKTLEARASSAIRYP